MRLFSFKYYLNLILLSVLLFPQFPVKLMAEEAPLSVVVSIKPLHSLVAMVMDGIGEPKLLIRGRQSPHDFQLKPSQAKLLYNADLIIRVGPLLETTLNKPIASLNDTGIVMNAIEAKDLQLLKIRSPHKHEDEHGHEDKHEHEGEHEQTKGHDDDVGAWDQHIWLSIQNAKVIVIAVGDQLKGLRPQLSEQIDANVEKAVRRLLLEESDFHKRLFPLKDRAYMVFHDAYQYFTAPLQLNFAGAVTLPSTIHNPSAKHLKKLRETIAGAKVVCIFSEPQFSPKLIDLLVQGTTIKTGLLDPIGVEISPGKDAYLELMDRLSHDMANCLK